MPLTAAGRKVLRNMQEYYGKEKGTRVFYATAHSHRGWHGESRRHRDAAQKGRR